MHVDPCKVVDAKAPWGICEMRFFCLVFTGSTGRQVGSSGVASSAADCQGMRNVCLPT